MLHRIDRKDLLALSSILKALKKLESDSVQLDAVHPWSRRTLVKGTFPAGIRESLLLKIVGSMGVVGILVMGGWYMSSNAPIPDKDQIEKDSPLQQKGVVHTQVSVPVQKEELGQPERTHRIRVSRDAPKKPIVPDLSKDGPRRIADHFPDRRVGLQPSIGERVPDEEADTRAYKVLSPTSREHPLIGERRDDTRLKLQAIAWSPDAEKRIAVINDRVVKEGDSIDGISVNHIDEDLVVVREEGLIWKIIFDLQ